MFATKKTHANANEQQNESRNWRVGYAILVSPQFKMVSIIPKAIFALIIHQNLWKPIRAVSVNHSRMLWRRSLQVSANETRS